MISLIQWPPSGSFSILRLKETHKNEDVSEEDVDGSDQPRSAGSTSKDLRPPIESLRQKISAQDSPHEALR